MSVAVGRRASRGAGLWFGAGLVALALLAALLSWTPLYDAGLALDVDARLRHRPRTGSARIRWGATC